VAELDPAGLQSEERSEAALLLWRLAIHGKLNGLSSGHLFL